MKIYLITASLILLAGSVFAQEKGRSKIDNSPQDPARMQAACENEILHDLKAKEVVASPENDMLAKITTAFGREQAPRLYLYHGEGNSYYVAGSAALDGRGKIVMSRKFAGLMGNTPALEGALAHEMAHLVLNLQRGERCLDLITSNPKTEEEADALAASKVGFEPVKTWLFKMRELIGSIDLSDTLIRIEKLRSLEAKQNEQRNY